MWSRAGRLEARDVCQRETLFCSYNLLQLRIYSGFTPDSRVTAGKGNYLYTGDLLRVLLSLRERDISCSRVYWDPFKTFI